MQLTQLPLGGISTLPILQTILLYNKGIWKTPLNVNIVYERPLQFAPIKSEHPKESPYAPGYKRFTIVMSVPASLMATLTLTVEEV